MRKPQSSPHTRIECAPCGRRCMWFYRVRSILCFRLRFHRGVNSLNYKNPRRTIDLSERARFVRCLTKKSCAGPFRRFRLEFQSRRRAQGIFALRHRIIEPLVFSGDLFDLANEGLAGGNLRKTGEVEMVTLDTFIVNRSRVDKSSGPKGIYLYRTMQ